MSEYKYYLFNLIMSGKLCNCDNCLNFNGIDCLKCGNVSWLYMLIGITQIVVLLLQIYGISVELDKCDYDKTIVEREISNWAAWLNGISLLLCGVWAALKTNSKTCKPCVEWLVKILWIGTTLASVLFSAITTGHTLNIKYTCIDEHGNTQITPKTVRDTSISILVLWFVLLALGHMGAKMRKDTTTNDGLAATTLELGEKNLGNDKLFFRGNKRNTIKF